MAALPTGPSCRLLPESARWRHRFPSVELDKACQDFLWLLTAEDADGPSQGRRPGFPAPPVGLPSSPEGSLTGFQLLNFLHQALQITVQDYSPRAARPPQKQPRRSGPRLSYPTSERLRYTLHAVAGCLTVGI